MNEFLQSLTSQDILRISEMYGYPFQAGRFFIPVKEDGDKTMGLLVFFGNYHNVSIPTDALEKPNAETQEMVLKVIKREMDESIYEVHEFTGFAVKHEALRIQKIVNKYQPNLSVWDMRSDELLNELEDDMIREGVSSQEIKDVTKELVESYEKAFKAEEQEKEFRKELIITM